LHKTISTIYIGSGGVEDQLLKFAQTFVDAFSSLFLDQRLLYLHENMSIVSTLGYEKYHLHMYNVKSGDDNL